MSNVLETTPTAGATPGEVIALNLRALRARRKVTQTQLAARAGIDRNTVYRIERGECPSTRVMARIAAALGTSVDRLLKPAA